MCEPTAARLEHTSTWSNEHTSTRTHEHTKAHEAHEASRSHTRVIHNDPRQRGTTRDNKGQRGTTRGTHEGQRGTTRDNEGQRGTTRGTHEGQRGGHTRDNEGDTRGDTRGATPILPRYYTNTTPNLPRQHAHFWSQSPSKARSAPILGLFLGFFVCFSFLG